MNNFMGEKRQMLNGSSLHENAWIPGSSYALFHKTSKPAFHTIISLHALVLRDRPGREIL